MAGVGSRSGWSEVYAKMPLTAADLALSSLTDGFFTDDAAPGRL